MTEMTDGSLFDDGAFRQIPGQLAMSTDVADVAGTLASPIILPCAPDARIPIGAHVWEHRGDWSDYVVQEESRGRVIGRMPAHDDYPSSLYVRTDLPSMT